MEFFPFACAVRVYHWKGILARRYGMTEGFFAARVRNAVVIEPTVRHV